MLDIKARKATRINKAAVNMVLKGDWIGLFDNNSLLYTAVNKALSMAPKKPLAPKGPVVQQNLGKVAGSVTFQDLIKNPFDETQFEFYAKTQLVKNTNGIETKIGSARLFTAVFLYLLIKNICWLKE